MKGVRLSLPEDPFVWQRIDIRFCEDFFVNDVDAPFSVGEMLRAGIILLPLPDMRGDFGAPVVYTSNVEAALQGLVERTVDGVVIPGNDLRVARIKSDAWSFQDEYRFVIASAPGPEASFSGDAAAYLDALRQMRGHRSFLVDVPQQTHVDLRLSPEALGSAEILVGPLAANGDLERVSSLVAEFAPTASVRASEHTGRIR